MPPTGRVVRGASALAGVGLACAALHQRKSAPVLADPGVRLSTGARIPSLGLGTYLANGEELHEAILTALAVGYRHIDTAAGYANERVVAAAIRASGLPRDAIFLTTKLWCDSHGSAPTREAIAKSLRALGTDYVDLYLIHAPDNQGLRADDIRRLRLESWMAMEAAHNEGSLRAIGVSNFEPRHIEQLLCCEDGTPREGAVVPAVNQIETHPHFDQRATRDYCARKGIAVEAYGALQPDVLSDPEVERVAAAHGRSPAQVSLRHTLQRGTIVLAKSLTPSRIAENARVFEFSLSEEDCAALDALARDPHRDGRNYWDNSDVP